VARVLLYCVMVKIDLSKVSNVEFDGIDHADYPDYCDAYISGADIEVDGVIRAATEAELDSLNDDPDNSEWRYEKLMQSIH
jgi:hypothetical protein